MPKVARQRIEVGGDELSIRAIAPPAGVPLRASVFVPPLIGGSGLQQVGYFRALNRRGYRLVTFDYRGHGKSGGRFSVRASLDDARAVLAELEREERSEPLYGLADCYGAIPLLVAAAAVPAALRALVLINPIPSLQHVAGPLTLLADHLLPRDARGRRRPALRSPFDLRGMLLATNARLFPEIDKSRDHFGILRYERTRWARAVLEYLFLEPLSGLRCELPARVCFGRADRLLGLDQPAAEARYRAAWAAHLPRAELSALEDADHFWSGVRERASELAAEFFESLAPAPAGLVLAHPRARQREPGERSGWNHQLGGRTTSSGLKRSLGR
jgi:pimeloyl-ACP methyl ester carboxylesterase